MGQVFFNFILTTTVHFRFCERNGEFIIISQLVITLLVLFFKSVRTISIVHDDFITSVYFTPPLPQSVPTAQRLTRKMDQKVEYNRIIVSIRWFDDGQNIRLNKSMFKLSNDGSSIKAKILLISRGEGANNFSLKILRVHFSKS